VLRVVIDTASDTGDSLNPFVLALRRADMVRIKRFISNLQLTQSFK